MDSIANVVQLDPFKPTLFQRFRGLLGQGTGSVLIPLLLVLLSLASNPAWHQHFHHAHLQQPDSTCPLHHAHDHISADNPHSASDSSSAPDSDTDDCDHCAITELSLGHATFFLILHSGLDFVSPWSELPTAPPYVFSPLHLFDGLSDRGPPAV